MSHSAYAVSKSSVQVRIYTMLTRIARYKWLLGLALLIFFLDQISKQWIIQNLPLGAYFPEGTPGVRPGDESITVIAGFFHIVHVRNTGAAWGLFEGMSQWLSLLGIVALVGIYFARKHLHLDLPVVQVSFGLLCGGILGNVVDRIRHGDVVDFLDFHFGNFTWPAFNIADSAICIGVAIYLICSFVRPGAIERKDEILPERGPNGQNSGK